MRLATKSSNRDFGAKYGLLRLCCGVCRYSTGYAIQPVLIRNSQADWLHPEEWTKEALQQQLKDESVFIDDAAECEDNELDMFEGHCTFVREGREELMGKEWAALTGVDMTGLGVSTYAELFDAQV